MAPMPAAEQAAPAAQAQTSPSWQPCILGTGKRQLLDKVLAILGSNRANQRLFAEVEELITEARQAGA